MKLASIFKPNTDHKKKERKKKPIPVVTKTLGGKRLKEIVRSAAELMNEWILVQQLTTHSLRAFRQSLVICFSLFLLSLQRK